MVAQQSKGVFLPYPLLGILVTVGILLVSGIIAIQVQVSNLNTTLLLRDADHARQVDDLKHELQSLRDKNDLLAMYIQDDREKLAVIKTKLGLPLK